MDVETDIISIIPQKPPFVMVDSLTRCSETEAVTTFQVKNDNIFLSGSRLQESALVENMAQTAAARMGYICKKENKAVPLGFIASVQNLHIQNLPQLNDTLETTVTITDQVFTATVIHGEIKSNNSLVASCDMKIFISDNA